jgi:hypothetical protein
VYEVRCVVRINASGFALFGLGNGFQDSVVDAERLNWHFMLGMHRYHGRRSGPATSARLFSVDEIVMNGAFSLFWVAVTRKYSAKHLQHSVPTLAQFCRVVGQTVRFSVLSRGQHGARIS